MNTGGEQYRKLSLVEGMIRKLKRSSRNPNPSVVVGAVFAGMLSVAGLTYSYMRYKPQWDYHTEVKAAQKLVDAEGSYGMMNLADQLRCEFRETDRLAFPIQFGTGLPGNMHSNASVQGMLHNYDLQVQQKTQLTDQQQLAVLSFYREHILQPYVIAHKKEFSHLNERNLATYDILEDKLLRELGLKDHNQFVQVLAADAKIRQNLKVRK